MFNLISISARKESKILPSIRNFLTYSSKVIIARHPESNPLSLSHANLLQFQGDSSYIIRLHQALHYVDSDFVLLSADDDFYIPSAVNYLSQECPAFVGMSCISAITTSLLKVTSSEICLSPYLVSSEVILRKSDSCPIREINHITSTFFRPLTIDFYSLYSTEKLRQVLDLFVVSVKPSTLKKVGLSMKLFQYLFSYSLSLIGSIIPVSIPLYMRGVEVPLRKQTEYTNTIVDAAELVSFSAEVKQFLADTASWLDFTQCLYDLCSKNTFHSFSSDLTVENIRLSLRDMLLSCVTQSSIGAMNLYCPQYQLHILRNSENVKVSKKDSHLVLRAPLDLLPKLSIPDYISSPLHPFLLESAYSEHLISGVESIWSSNPAY